MESTPKPSRRSRSTGFAAALILAIGIALSLVSAYIAHKELQRDAEGAFLSDARDLARAIENETTAYEEVLTGLGSFMSASRNVSAEDFRHYVEGLQLTKRFPGFQNLNYAEQSGEQHVIRFIEPLERNRQFLGRDIAPLPGPREGLAQARDTGKALTSGRLIRPRGDAHIGLAIRRAVYDQNRPIGTVAERRAAYRGTVGAGYRPVDLVRLVLESGRYDYLRFRMHDVGAVNEPVNPAQPSDERLLLDSAQLGIEPLAGGAHYETSIRFPVSGRVWQLAMSAPQRADGLATRLLPLLTLALGVSASLLLFALVRSLASSRQRAEALARDITRELRDSEENLSNAQRMAALGNWWLDVEHGRMHWSQEALRLLGRSNEDAPRDFNGLLACIHEDDREQLRTRLAGARLDATNYDLELRLHGSDGILRWVHALGQAKLDGEGRIAKLRGTFMDITVRKTNERRTDLEVALSRLLSSPRAPTDTLQDVLRTTAGMYGWSAARLWERGDDGLALRLTAAAGDLEAAVVNATQDLLAAAASGQTAWGKTFLDAKAPLWFGAQGANAMPMPESLQGPGGCILLLPVVTGDEVSDALAFYSSGGNCGDEATLHAMQIVASQLSHYLQRRRAEDNLMHVAMHDPLTGLPNRRQFHQALSAGITRAKRAGHGLGVLFVDLDRFKNINDALGHSAGDQVLKVCAQRFAEALRESDLIAHISGDEFVVLLERCNDSAAAIAVARKLLSAATRPILLDGQELALTASIGIALYPADGADGEALLKHADIALFRAKEQGRNNYQFYSAQMNTHTAERLAMEAKLRHALDRGELSLHYQPKLDVRTRQVSGVEALLRWNSPELGAVSPATFIPLAEETGLIVPIGAWVLREACKQAKRWQDSGLPGTRVAVNLSARQFRDPLLGQAISRAFAESGLDPRLLELEITESMVMQEPEKAAALLEDLKAMGLYLSIDDFGTGYSSLAYLKRFPIDSLKIDRSFIKDIPANSDDLAITQAVIAMAHGLRLRTVAEGVETEEQLEWLKRFGCEEIQGYLFSKPLPAEEAGRFLAASFRKENTDRFGRGKSVVVA
jgi:diguanylate cyclase (GGDEF)-like protein